MDIHLIQEDRDRVHNLEANASRHITAVNDICSFEKELQSSQSGHHEGSALCSSVQVLSAETGLGFEAAKRVLWAMCREWEHRHEELTKECFSANATRCSEDLRAYTKGLEYQMSGNELWSLTTPRYSVVV